MLAALSGASLLVMLAADALLGAQAEFLNAWSVVERLLGRSPTAGDSMVYRVLGAAGELAVVLVANLAIGSGLFLLLRLCRGRWT